jgi:glycosyltransferase involved in cell wall biosynthesis
LPNALLEAAAAGLPLVATPASDGVRELLEAAPGTWSTREVSANALSRSILTALSTLPNPPIRFEHDFLTPFEAQAATATTAAIVEKIVARDKPAHTQPAAVRRTE